MSEPVVLTRRERLQLWGLVLAASLFYGAYAVLKHGRFMTGGYDLGIFDQHLWLASRGLPLANTVRDLPHLWGDHLHVLAIGLTPLYWLGDGARNLLAVQALLVCAAAWPLYLFARDRMPHAPAMLLSAGFLVAWPVGEGLGFDFHDLALAAPLLAWAILLFDRRRLLPFAVVAGLLLLTREDQGFTVAAFGLLAFLRREWILGLVLGLVGTAYTAVAVKLVIPHFAGGTFAHWAYGHISPDPAGLLVALATRPKLLIESLLVPFAKVALVRRFFEPVLYLGLFSPIVLLAAPGIILRLLSNKPSHWIAGSHYGLVTAVVIAFATTDAFARLLPLFREEVRNRVAIRGGLILLAGGVIGAALVPQKSYALPSFWADNPARAAGRRALALIPPTAPVVATNQAIPHLTHRAEAHLDWGYYRDHPQVWTPAGEMPLDRKISLYRRAEYLIFDPFAPNPEGVTLASDLPEFARIFDEAGWIVFRRR